MGYAPAATLQLGRDMAPHAWLHEVMGAYLWQIARWAVDGRSWPDRNQAAMLQPAEPEHHAADAR